MITVRSIRWPQRVLEKKQAFVVLVSHFIVQNHIELNQALIK